MVHRPSDAAEAAHIVADAAARKVVLSPVGHGSKSGVGQIADKPVEAVSSSGLSGIIQYNPAEMVFVAHAGTSMGVIDAALKEAKQRLIFEPANWSGLFGETQAQTIGGIAATNMSGPRRFAAGAARDSLLGLKYINGRGDLIKSGGQVMKNVTGLDLVKLLCGSWGTLGLITEVSYKAVPIAETETTLAIAGIDNETAAKVMARAMATSCEVTGAAHLPDGKAFGLDGAATVLRLEGLAGSVADRVERLKSALGSAHDIATLSDEPSRDLWSSVGDVAPFCDGTDKPVWRISVPPMSGWKVVRAIADAADCDAFFDWQGGLVWLRLADETDARAALIRKAVAKNGGGHATLIRASEALRKTVPVFEPEAPAITALNGRIRAAIDPYGVFATARTSAPAPANAA